MSLGYAHHAHKDQTHAVELTYDAADGAKGFQGFPIGFNFGNHYRLSDKTHLKAAINIGEHYGGCLKVDHQLTDHIHVGSHQEFDSSKLASKADAYEIGFSVKYNL